MITHSAQPPQMALYSSGHLLVAQYDNAACLSDLSLQKETHKLLVCYSFLQKQELTLKKKTKQQHQQQQQQQNCDEPNSLFMTK
jgi:hypothetical protein